MTVATWIDEDDVIRWPRLPENVNSLEDIEDLAQVASDLLYDATAQQYPGVQEETRRPCRTGGSCWEGDPAARWLWTSSYVSGSWYWFWGDDRGASQCGCGALSQVQLPGDPIVSVTEVKVDGAVVASSGYRVDQGGWLVRLAAPDGTAQQWPACQRLDLPDTQPGTWSVKYKWGAPPPEAGKLAAVELALELWAAKTGGKCRLPQKVTKAVRQGVQIERVVPFAKMLSRGETGLVFVDLFIGSANPTGMQRPPAVLSPDSPRYAPRLGL